MKKKFKYKTDIQRETVIEVVTMLLNRDEASGLVLSKETLKFIVDHYCSIVDPPNKPEDSWYVEGDET